VIAVEGALCLLTAVLAASADDTDSRLLFAVLLLIAVVQVITMAAPPAGACTAVPGLVSAAPVALAIGAAAVVFANSGTRLTLGRARLADAPFALAGIPLGLLLRGAAQLAPGAGINGCGWSLVAGFAVSSAVLDELLNRGLVLSATTRALGPRRGMWTAIVLSVLGQLPAGTLPRIVVMLLLAAVLAEFRQRTGSLYGCLGLHVLLNVTAFGLIL
jgi:hypothetical protein